MPSGWWLALGVLLGVAVATGVAYWLTARSTRALADVSIVGWQDLTRCGSNCITTTRMAGRAIPTMGVPTLW